MPMTTYEAKKIEIALDCGEELIRKKKHYGTELGELSATLLSTTKTLQMKTQSILHMDSLV